MTRRLTKEAIRKLLTKGLTGWESGKLVLQDFADRYRKNPPFLTDADVSEIKRGLSGEKNINDYNDLMAMGKGIERGLMVCSMTWPEACLDLCTLIEMLNLVEKKNVIELFASCKPRVVTAKQYQDIVAAQREKKLKFEYCLGYVIEERFYAIAPAGVREEIDGLGIDIESAESFAAAVPEKYAKLYKQSVSEVHKLYIEDKLKAVYHDEDTKVVESLLNEWKKQNLSDKDVMKLVDMLFVTGQRIYDCDELPEWKDYMDKYNKYLFGDEDERFRYSYAILEDCPECWMDEQGYYKSPISTGEWIIRTTELIWGLRAIENEKPRSVQSVSQMFLAILNRAELNIRIFLGVKTVIDTASEIVGVSFSDDAGVMDSEFKRMEAYIGDYNKGLQSLKGERRRGNAKESKLEKVLKTLPLIDIAQLKPSAESIEWLKNNIITNNDRDEWLQEKVHSLEYDDGYSFASLKGKD